MSTPITAMHISDDLALRDAIESELSWTPEVDSNTIGVAVSNGAVTLTGDVEHLSQRVAAVAAAQRARGVSVVADELRVRESAGGPTDTDIAEAVAHTLHWLAALPEGAVDAVVHDHTVTLTGTVEWNYLREATENAVRSLSGVHFVDNRIELSRRPDASNVTEEIGNALRRNAILDAEHIHVSITGHELTLTGEVHSWAEKRQAGLTAWASPHVDMVHNHLRVIPV